MIVLGVMPDYRHTGVALGSTRCTLMRPNAHRRRAARWGWTLEVNEPINRALEGMGAEIKGRYRVYERAL